MEQQSGAALRSALVDDLVAVGQESRGPMNTHSNGTNIYNCFGVWGSQAALKHIDTNVIVVRGKGITVVVIIVVVQ